MTLYLKNMPVGQNHTASVTIGSDTGQATISAHKLPSLLTEWPYLDSEQRETSTLTIALNGLTNPSYQWYVVGGSNLGTSATQSAAGNAMSHIGCTVTADQGTFEIPPVYIYPTIGMGASMIKDEAESKLTVPYDDVTVEAVADGNWSNTATWSGGRVPVAGDFVLIRHGRTITYDMNEPNLRLDRVRVDGTLNWDVNTTCAMFVETIGIARGAVWTMGTGGGNRVNSANTHRVIFSARSYHNASFVSENLNISADIAAWSRGLICHGELTIWGTDKIEYGRAEYSSSFNGTTWDFTPLTVGDTSLQLDRDPTGWQVGDTIVICGTDFTYTGTGQIGHQFEEREITGISGRTVSWSGGLAYDHGNPLTESTRTDLEPVVFLKEGRNVSFEAEDETASRSGHLAFIGMGTEIDIWDAQFIGLGRTNKSIIAGVQNDSGEFKTLDNDVNTITEPFEPTSNILGRYSLHFHHAGLNPNDGRLRVLHSCYVGRSPGHAVIHHMTHADIVNCVAYEFFGAGFVGETGPETGRWDGNIAAKTTCDLDDIGKNLKILESGFGNAGDLARHGVGFFMRGRAINHVNNIAIGCSHGHANAHRGRRNPSFSIAQVVDPKRSVLDLREIGRMAKNNTPFADFEFGAYPLHLTQKNEAIACLNAMFVGKSAPEQFHDYWVRIADFMSWGCWTGATLEYVGKYILQRFDTVSGRAGEGTGLNIGQNMFGIQTDSLRTEGFENSWLAFVDDTKGAHDVYDAPDDPRYMIVGLEAVDCLNAAPGIVQSLTTKTLAQVSVQDDDLQGAFLDRDALPSWTGSGGVIKQGQWDGAGTFTPTVTNATGSKSDNISSAAPMFPDTHGDTLIASVSTLEELGSVVGYWQFDPGSGAVDAMIWHEILTDRATGIPAVVMNWVELTGTGNAGADNGAFSRASSDPVQAFKEVNTAAQTPVVIDMVSGATGGDGSTYEIWDGAEIFPRFGRLSVNYGTGETTYTPFDEHLGADEFTQFVVSGNRYTTVKVSILTGTLATGTAPIVDTHFLAYDHADANTIGLQLIAKPNVGDQDIVRTEYSTDGGSTWRRLCHKWIRAIHKITVESDGTPIIAGNYNVRLRYKTDHNHLTSSASADDAVTVT